jgi:RNA polymerase sigma-70 factor (ECF subfamily)
MTIRRRSWSGRASSAPESPVAPDEFEVATARLYREVWGRAVAALNRTLGDLDLAEDVLQEAWLVAIERWRREGIPSDPTAWLLTTARNKAVDRIRRATNLKSKERLLVETDSTDPWADMPASSITDDRLRLMFTCCHPALSIEARVALTLRTLGGLTTPEIASAFLVTETTMGQRLSRAKRKIGVAGIPYEVPPDHALPERLASILAVIYLVFTEGYSSSSGEQLVRLELCEEAIRLARLLVALMPDEAEARGILALMILHHSRRRARLSASGDILLLEDQVRAQWDRAAIEEGLELVERALPLGTPGPYLLQAAIAGVHAGADSFEATDWAQIVALYGLLYERAPSPVVELNRAVAVAMRDGVAVGFELIDRLMADKRLERFHLLHAARADLLRRMGRNEEAAVSYQRALELQQSTPERRYLEQRLAEARSSG